MKAKNLKPMIISALLAVGFGASTVGTSFALFTDSAETNINVTAGKVDINATLRDVVTYSAEADSQGTLVDENNNKYVHVEQAPTIEGGVVTKYNFVNGGYATITDNVLDLVNITPGDKINFGFDLSNTSNVSFKYRFYYKVLEENFDLSKGLETSLKVGSGEWTKYVGLEEYRSTWQLQEATATLDNLDFSIELPINAGNVYQAKNAKILIAFEAVQGNAFTTDAGLVKTTEVAQQTFDDLVNKAVADGENDTVVSAASPDNQVAITTTIPAAAQEVANNDTVTLSVTEVSTNEVSATNTLTIDFDVTLKVNETVTTSFSEPIKIELYIGPNRDIASITHHATTGDIAITDYVYDPVTGVVTFYSTSFSPFTVEYYELPDPDVYPVHIGKTGYETLDAALAAVVDGDTISLSNDIEYTGNIDIPDGKSIGIDLCGKNLETTKRMRINASTTVKVKDSSAGQLGRFAVLSDSFVAQIVGQGAKLTLESGKLVQTSTAPGIGIGSGGTFVMNDGVLTAGYAGVYDWDNSTIIMNGGTVNGNTFGVLMGVDSSFTMNGGKINATGYGIGNYNNGRVVINDGEVYSGDYALFTNGGDSLFADIEVNGGKLISQGTALYLAGCHTFKMTDGLIQGTMGVLMRAGTATISGGRIVATAEQVALARGGESGFDGGDGVAFSFIQHTTKQDMILNVTGGSFEGKIGIHVSNFNDNDEYKNDPGTSTSVDGSSPLYDEFNNPVKAQFIVNMTNASFSNDCLCPVLITDSRYTVTLPQSVLNSLPSVLELPSATVTLSNDPAWLYVLAEA